MTCLAYMNLLMDTHQTLKKLRQTSPSHLMCALIQDPVLSWGQREPTRGEVGAVRSLGGAGRAGVPPWACAHLVLALILLSPVESLRPPEVSAIPALTPSSQEKDAHPADDHKSPDHIQCNNSGGPKLCAPVAVHQ